MLFQRRLIIVILGFFLLCFALIWASYHQIGLLKRDKQVLMNTYYQLKDSNPDAAREALYLILKQNKHDVPALIELSQWFIQEERLIEALPFLEQLHQQRPDDRQYSFQLAYLYYKTGQWERSKPLFMALSHDTSEPWRSRAEDALRAMNSFIPHYKDWVHARFFYPGLSGHEQNEPNLDTFYHLRKQHRVMAARAYIETINKTYPRHIQALKEAGLLAIQEGRSADAIELFTRAYAITGDPATAMQIGYLYSGLGLNKTAFYYFGRASHSTDKKLSWLAQDGMTRLSGQQTKALSDPYYGEFFFMPFTQNRFGITVSQFIARLGVEFSLPMNPRVYTFTRRTQDNRGTDVGELTQLYEDNVWVTGVGGQFFPFKQLPLFVYVEAGGAYDLFFRARERWRPDLRAGFMYYQEFGAMPSYYGTPTYSTNYYSIWYAEMTYFSRYDNNVIASIRTHQGIRLLQYKSSMINLFIRGRVIEDSRRDFYNNFAELGPGLGITPSNRYNVEIHLDYINGMYLPAGGRQPNPFSKFYSNKRALLLCYVKF